MGANTGAYIFLFVAFSAAVSVSNMFTHILYDPWCGFKWNYPKMITYYGTGIAFMTFYAFGQSPPLLSMVK